MSGNNWENTKQKFGFVLKIAKHKETHIEHHFPAGWWALCIVTAFFWSSVVERGLKDEFQSAYLVPEMEVGWNVGSEVQESNPEKTCSKGLSCPTDTKTPKPPSFSASGAFQRLVLVPSSHLDSSVPWGPCVHLPAELCQCHGASSAHRVHPKEQPLGWCAGPSLWDELSSASATFQGICPEGFGVSAHLLHSTWSVFSFAAVLVPRFPSGKQSGLKGLSVPVPAQLCRLLLLQP